MLTGYYFITTDIDNKKAHSIQVLKTVESLNRAGCNIAIVAPRYKEKYDFNKTFQYYNIKHKFTIKLLFNFGFSIMGKAQIIFYNISAIFFLLRLKAKRQINFIYIRSEFLAPLVFIAKILQIPYFFEVHRTGKNKLGTFLKNRIVKNAKGIVAITNSLKQHYIKFNKNIVVAHCGFDEDVFYIEEEKYNLEKNIFKIGYVGSLGYTQGVQVAIKAMKYLPDCKLYIVGGNDKDRERLQNEATKSHIINVKFIGRIPYKDVVKWMKSFDILVITELRSDKGASSVKTYEYMACQKPIVATMTDANLEILHNKKNSIMIDMDNPKKLIEAINILKKNNYLRDAIANQAIIDSRKYIFKNRGLIIYRFIKSLIIN